MSRGLLTKRCILFSLAWFCFFLPSSDLFAGDYLDSAHGSSSVGVYRKIIGDQWPAGFGYSRGNCAHCHEQHASLGGIEPTPSLGASPYEIFAPNFKTDATVNLYSESDNFCFYCHKELGTAQSVTNYDYSKNFGCAPPKIGVGNIMSTMNQKSYHNLKDVWNLAKDEYSDWFTNDSNPCNACHNPHLAKQNWANPQDPTYSAISKPSEHFSLWGTTETMGSNYNTQYQPPFCSDSLLDREPANSNDAADGRDNTPDYVAFCTTCHTATNTQISSTVLGTLKTINWGSGGDKHGLGAMDGTVSTKPPYDSTSGETDFVLSCLDCHEPHGSENVMLIRRRVNGSDLSAAITSLENTDMGLLCLKCHMDDYAFDHDVVNSWEHVHHLVEDAPYTKVLCSACHPQAQADGDPTRGGPNPIPCQQCHFHGSVF